MLYSSQTLIPSCWIINYYYVYKDKNTVHRNPILCSPLTLQPPKPQPQQQTPLQAHKEGSMEWFHDYCCFVFHYHTPVPSLSGKPLSTWKVRPCLVPSLSNGLQFYVGIKVWLGFLQSAICYLILDEQGRHDIVVLFGELHWAVVEKNLWLWLACMYCTQCYCTQCFCTSTCMRYCSLGKTH